MAVFSLFKLSKYSEILIFNRLLKSHLWQDSNRSY